MDYMLVMQSEALIDMQEAFEWYELQKPGLGFELVNEMEYSLIKLRKNPQYYTAINEKFRRIRTDRFPYLIIYEITNDTIIVIAVRRISQKPKY